jgi:glycosyltransferase involved in cell wall biosynthesis
MQTLNKYFHSKVMLLSIIIPTKNEEVNIARLLGSIVKDKAFDTEHVEIIVIDNPTTTDKTREIAQKYPVTLDIVGPERSSQRNRGAHVATGEYICFVDADMEFRPGLLQEILDHLKPDSALVIPERIPGSSLYCRALNIEKQVYDNNRLISAARVFFRKTFLDIGGFNTDMISGEDWELDRRYTSTGAHTVHLKHVLFHHEENIGFTKSIKKKIYYAKKLNNYRVGFQREVNPIYRYSLLFSKPSLIFKDPFAFIYLILLKTSQFSIGVFTYLTK